MNCFHYLAYRILDNDRLADSSNKLITARTLIPAQIILVNSIVSSSAAKEGIDQSPRAVSDKRHAYIDQVPDPSLFS